MTLDRLKLLTSMSVDDANAKSFADIQRIKAESQPPAEPEPDEEAEPCPES